MSETDPFEYDDAAYVLGALSAEEHAAFEEHLRSCGACAARLREIQDVPDLLAAVTADDLGADEPMPDTLLPGLLRRATTQRRRQRWLISGLASVAAACVLALAVLLWPSTSSSNGHSQVAQRPFAAVANSPVRATATLTAKAWGTAIALECHYLPDRVDRSFSYRLVVYDRSGHTHSAGDWTLPPDKDIKFPTGTAVPLAQIAKIEITLSNGTPILRLTN